MFTNKASYENRKELLIHYLKELHNSNKPISYSDLLTNNLPSGGINEFESAMVELENKKWIIKTEEKGPPIPGFPHLRARDINYSISLEGIEYLDSLGIINDKFKIKKEENKPSINNYGNMVYGDNPQGILQGSDLRENHLNINSKERTPAIPKEQPTDTSKIKINSDLGIWNKLYKWTDHKLISMIVYSIIGFLIAKAFAWLGWF